MLELCAQVEGPSHCGRLVEAEQLKVLPNLAVRDGDTLQVSLFPSGTRDFVDTIASQNERTYALWDYWSPINAVVLFTTVAGDVTVFGAAARDGRGLGPARGTVACARSAARGRRRLLRLALRQRDHRVARHARRPAQGSQSRAGRGMDGRDDGMEKCGDADHSSTRRLAKKSRARRSGRWRTRNGSDSDVARLTADAGSAPASPVRPVRSYVLRQGRMSPAQPRALD